MQGARALPDPHAHNDYEICRERDADFHTLGEAFNKPGKRPLLLCVVLGSKRERTARCVDREPGRIPPLGARTPKLAHDPLVHQRTGTPFGAA
jgi:hypothetical protein